MEYYSSIEKNKKMPLARTQMAYNSWKCLLQATFQKSGIQFVSHLYQQDKLLHLQCKWYFCKRKKVDLYTQTSLVRFSSVQLLSCVQLFVTPWITARQASLSITNSRSPPKLMSIESVTPSNHLILCGPLLLLSSIFPSIRVFSNESVLRVRWPKYWSFSFNISPSSEHAGLISFRMDGLDLKGLSRVFSNTTVQKHQFFSAQPRLEQPTEIRASMMQ